MTASANCDACHKGSYATWKNGKLHANYSLSGQCATCHTGNYLAAVGKPATAIHAGVTSCEGCHKSSTWHVNAFSHSAANAVGTGSCDTCHGAGPAKGKSSGHVPITVSNAKCDSCHKSLVSFATSVTMNHNAVSSMMCKACHSGSYLGHGQRALAKPGNHIPETMLVLGVAMDCRSCHLTSSNWKAVKMDHNGSQGGGAGWCKGCHLAGTKFSGRMERMALSHDARHRPTPNPPNPPNDCSSAGCHKPLGNKGASFAKWD
jgi:hypothetical protein